MTTFIPKQIEEYCPQCRTNVYCNYQGRMELYNTDSIYLYNCKYCNFSVAKTRDLLEEKINDD